MAILIRSAPQIGAKGQITLSGIHGSGQRGLAASLRGMIFGSLFLTLAIDRAKSTKFFEGILLILLDLTIGTGANQLPIFLAFKPKSAEIRT